MENVLTGKIINISEIKTGVSQGGKEWKKMTFVIENNNGYLGKTQIFAFDIFNTVVENFIKYMELNMVVDVSFNIDCNEYEGAFFTKLNAWKVFSASKKQTPEPVAQTTAQTQSTQNDFDEPEGEYVDDLPF